MRRLVLCVSAALVLCLILLPRLASAQSGLEIENVLIEKSPYPPIVPSDKPSKIYVGDLDRIGCWVRYQGGFLAYQVKIFLDNVFKGTASRGLDFNQRVYFWLDGLSIPKPGEHEILIEAWSPDETQPRDTYSFNVLAVKPEVSGLQASSKVVRARGDNSLVVSFTNGGNENMRQAVLSVANSGGLTITPSSVELGDVNPGEQVSASFDVSSPAGVMLGTALVRFSLSFIDYAGVSHTEDVSGAVEVYRLSPTLTVSAPSSVENGTTVEIAATLKDPGGNPIANENITLTAGGVTIGTFKTDSSGVARASYKAAETGTVNVGASFPGSASYDAALTSGELTVTPAVAFPYWVILLIALPIALAAVLMIWRRKRGEVRPARKIRRSKATS